MTFDQLIIPILTFLLGWLLKSEIDGRRADHRLTQVETGIGNLDKNLTSLSADVKSIKPDSPPCIYLVNAKEAIIKEVADLKGRISTLEQTR